MDRDTVLRTAERLIRQGRIDRAIAEYVRLIEDQPDDWASMNALGDLYLRTGAHGEALAQFVRVADHEFDEGFLPKAAALYRKALRVQATDEHTLLRLAAIATRQGLTAEARQHLRQVARQREARGDEAGAATCILQLGLLEDADVEARVAAARAAQTLQDPAQAASLLETAARELAAEQPARAFALRVEAARIHPDDLRLRAAVARDAIAHDDEDAAREFLSRDAAGDDPDLLLWLGRIELKQRPAEAFAAFTRFVAVAPGRVQELADLATDLGHEADVALGYGCLEIVADAALLDADWRRAVDVLVRFTAEHAHAPALLKLVEVAGDADLPDVQREARRRLLEVYEAEGRIEEAAAVAQALGGERPHPAAHVEPPPADQARAAPVADPEPAVGARDADPDRAGIPAGVSGEGHTGGDVPGESDTYGFGMLDLFETSEPEPASGGATLMPEGFDAPFSLNLEALMAEIDASSVGEPAPDAPDAADGEVIEVDLSDAVSGWSGGPTEDVEPPGDHPMLPPDPQIEEVFGDLRRQAERDQQFADAEAEYARGLEALDAGRRDDGLAALAAAARAPALRFTASSRLGAAYLDANDLGAAVEWFERAAAAPPPSAGEGHAVLDGLAQALERLGETDRALAVLLELEADAGAYRDVRDRIARLRAGSPGGRPA